MYTAQDFLERINEDIITLKAEFDIVEFENLRVVQLGLDSVALELDMLDDGQECELLENIAGCVTLLFGRFADIFRYELRLRTLDTMEEVEVDLEGLLEEFGDGTLSCPPSTEFRGWDAQRRKLYDSFLSVLVN